MRYTAFRILLFLACAVSALPSEATALDDLMSRFADKSCLTRVALLESIDASATADETRAIALFLDALRDDDPLVRDAAVRALTHRLSETNSILTEADLADVQGETADLARVRLASLNHDRGTLTSLLLQSDAPVQQAAFEAFAALDSAAAVELLQAEFHDTSSLRRLQTLDLLARSPYTNSPATLIPLLQEAAHDADPLVRHRATTLLKTADPKRF